MLALLLALQVAPQWLEPATPESFAVAARALDGELLDGRSARFRDVKANRGRVCGFVNAKNRLGAYVGWEPFAVVVALPESPLIYVADAEMVELLCTSEGAPAQDRTSDMATAMAQLP